jgi:hypothetical protein
MFTGFNPTQRHKEVRRVIKSIECSCLQLTYHGIFLSISVDDSFSRSRIGGERGRCSNSDTYYC